MRPIYDPFEDGSRSQAELPAADVCERCNGTRLVTIHFHGNEGVPEWDADDQPCPECTSE